jgi:hypothetical protein
VSDPKDSRLSRIYREGAWPEPSRQIDQAILSASRRAAREERSFARRWAPSFAVAATVVLTSAIVLKVIREQPEVVSPSVSDKETGIRAIRSLPAAETKTQETKPAPAAAEQPAPTPQGFSSSMDAAEAARLERLRRDLDLKQGPIPSESPLPEPKSALVDKPAPALKKEASDSLQRRPDLPQSVRAREQRPANAPVSVFGASPPVQSPAQTAAPAPASAPAPTAPPSAAATTAGVTSALSVSATKAPERSPQAWIEDIRKLMKAGMSEEAGGELALFKKRYPDYVLPEDLR